MAPLAERLTEKIQTLNPKQLIEVEQFVECLKKWPVETRLIQETAALSEPSFAAIWNNPEDDAYDAL